MIDYFEILNIYFSFTFIPQKLISDFNKISSIIIMFSYFMQIQETNIDTNFNNDPILYRYK